MDSDVNLKSAKRPIEEEIGVEGGYGGRIKSMFVGCASTGDAAHSRIPILIVEWVSVRESRSPCLSVVHKLTGTHLQSNNPPTLSSLVISHCTGRLHQGQFPFDYMHLHVWR